MPHFSIVDQISLGGFRHKNEDRLGLAGRHAFVVDGATGLGAPFMPGVSDAGWLAQRAAESIGRRSQEEPAQLVEGLADDLIAAFAAEATRPLQHRWELPCGAFMLASLADGGVTLSWTGDCRAILRTDAGLTLAFGATAESEAEEAAQVTALSQGPHDPAARFNTPEVLASMRASRGEALAEGRARHLSPDRGWLPRVRHATVEAQAADILLMTDGFAAAELRYDLYAKPEDLIAAAREEGLQAIAATLRRFERETDPEGVLKPRWKRSDDATALWVRFEA